MKIQKLIKKHSDSLIKMVLDHLTMPIISMILIMSVTVLGLVLIPGVDSNGETKHLLFSEAFYFMIYTATTIGYGEITNFTYTQQLWVIFSIILSVVGWFYLLSSIVRLMSNKIFQERLSLRSKILEISNLERKYVVMINYKNSYDLFIDKVLGKDITIIMVVDNQNDYDRLKMKYNNNEIIIMNLEIISDETLISFGIEKKNLTNIIISMDDIKDIFDLTMLIKSLNNDVKITTFSKTIEQDRLLEGFDIDNIISSRKYIATDIINLLNNPELAEIGEFVHGELLFEDFAKLTLKEEPNVLIVGGGHITEFLLNQRRKNSKLNITIIDKKTSVEKSLSKYGGKIKFKKANLLDEKLVDVVELKDYDYVLILLDDDFLNVYVSKQIDGYDNIEKIIKINEQKNRRMVESEKVTKILTVDKLQSIELENILTKPDIVEYRNELFKMSEDYILDYHSYMVKKMKNKEIREVIIDSKNAHALYKKLKSVEKIDVNLLMSDLEDIGGSKNKIIPLCVIKENGTVVLIPFFEDTKMNLFVCNIEINDKIIYVPLTERSDYIFKFILENENELNYVLEHNVK